MRNGGIGSWIEVLKSQAGRWYNSWYFNKYRDLSPEEVFLDIYRRNIWNSRESRSGPGSELEQTSMLLQELPKLLTRLQVTRLLDIPCGDWNWMQHVELGDAQYLGADIIDGLILENKRLYHRDNVEFERLDILNDQLPLSDLILCRDCLVHFSYRDAAKALLNLLRSGSEYLLTSTFCQQYNADIVTGAWRPVNLQEMPFNFPEPLLLLPERCTEGRHRYHDKSLGLWKLSHLREEIERMASSLA